MPKHLVIFWDLVFFLKNHLNFRSVDVRPTYNMVECLRVRHGALIDTCMVINTSRPSRYSPGTSLLLEYKDALASLSEVLQLIGRDRRAVPLGGQGSGFLDFLGSAQGKTWGPPCHGM